MLTDVEIKGILKRNPKMIYPFPGAYQNINFDDAAWLEYDSPIQASSVDLHAGKIFIPGKKRGKEGSHGNGADAYTIKQGESVIVSTYEQLDLPGNISGIVFPPSGKLSSKAILVSNIGHIDPGFKGCLRFTLINMGSEEFTICTEKAVVGTLLLFKTANSAEKNWLDRACAAGKVSGGKSEPDQSEIDALASNFAGMDKKMKKIVDETMTSFRYLKWNVGLPVALTAAVSIGIYVITLFWGQVADIKKDNVELQKEFAEQRKELLDIREKYQILNKPAQNSEISPVPQESKK